MPNDLSRRSTLGLIAGGALAVSLPLPAWALTVEAASSLIDKLVGDINRIIASGKGEAAMIADFEKVFNRYGDVAVIAQSALGPAGRQASAGQKKAFTKAFSGYLSRKYGRQFREFQGGKIEVTGARQVKSYFEVVSTAYLPNEAPFEVRWHVSDKSGRDLFFNLIIEGVNMLATERTEIGAMLDKRGGDIDRLIVDLAKAG